MRRVLVLAATASMIMHFNIRNIEILRRLGYKVHVASNFENYGSMNSVECDKLIGFLEENNVEWHQIDFDRGIGNFNSNIKALKQLNDVLKTYSEWAFVHAHSPLGGVLGRIAAKINKIPAIYTAHGFHFSKSGSLKNWAIFPIELMLSLITSEIIVINKADYSLAKKYFPTQVSYIPSVGTNIKERMDIPTKKRRENFWDIRSELGLSEEKFIYFSAGELNNNKNHGKIIEAMNSLPDNTILLIAGVGENEDRYHRIINECGLSNRVKLLGYRKDLQKIHHASDAFVFPSKREGLGMSGLDALADGLYIIGSSTTNMSDFISNASLGKLINPNSLEEMVESMYKVFTEKRRPDLSANESHMYMFDSAYVDKIMEGIYLRHME